MSKEKIELVGRKCRVCKGEIVISRAAQKCYCQNCGIEYNLDIILRQEEIIRKVEWAAVAEKKILSLLLQYGELDVEQICSDVKKDVQDIPNDLAVVIKLGSLMMRSQPLVEPIPGNQHCYRLTDAGRIEAEKSSVH